MRGRRCFCFAFFASLILPLGLRADCYDSLSRLKSFRLVWRAPANENPTNDLQKKFVWVAKFHGGQYLLALQRGVILSTQQIGLGAETKIRFKFDRLPHENFWTWPGLVRLRQVSLPSGLIEVLEASLDQKDPGPLSSILPEGFGPIFEENINVSSRAFAATNSRLFRAALLWMFGAIVVASPFIPTSLTPSFFNDRGSAIQQLLSRNYSAIWNQEIWPFRHYLTEQTFGRSSDDAQQEWNLRAWIAQTTKSSESIDLTLEHLKELKARLQNSELSDDLLQMSDWALQDLKPYLNPRR